jgi:signal transduction histidine kinase
LRAYAPDRPGCGETGSGRRLAVRRRDNGIGISQECYQQVFEPFSRLHDRSKFEGTGLGLATCKKIVERHGGVIWCESTLHQGATFFFKLPNCSAGA